MTTLALSNEARGVLRRVRDEVLTEPGRWTQEEFARNATGRSVGIFDKSAVCWCLDGALAKAAGGASTGEYAKHLDAALGTDLFGFIAWQDAPERTFDEVRALLDRVLGEEAV